MPRWLDSLRRSASNPPAGGGLSAAAGGTHSAADWAAWNVQRKPIAWLKPNPRNAKKHGPEQIAQLRAALRQFGWTMPVLARDDGMIIAGHGRVEAAKLEGITEAPVIIPNNWTADQFRAYALADNRIAENSDWDEELLALELADLKVAGADLSLDLGFSAKELTRILAPAPTPGQNDPNAAPDKPELPISRVGDVWLLGKHRLLCGDCTVKADVERLMSGSRAAAVIADPPYGMKLDTDFSTMVGANAKGGNTYPAIVGDNQPYNPAPIFTAFGKCAEIFLFGADYYAESIPDRNLGSWLVWDKRKETQAEAFGSEFELCWSKARHKRRVLRHDWFGFLSSANQREARDRLHPAQKPTSLIRDIITQWVDGLVVDPYAGSGTTIIAAEMTELVCYAMEIEPGLCRCCGEALAVLRRRESHAGRRRPHL